VNSINNDGDLTNKNGNFDQQSYFYLGTVSHFDGGCSTPQNKKSSNKKMGSVPITSDNHYLGCVSINKKAGVFSCKIAISHVPQFPSEIVFAK
jgi:hypothetical protein